MKFLCLAYGREEDWLVLSESQRAELLAQDDLLRQLKRTGRWPCAGPGGRSR